ncbi:hypothetical protein SH449x_002992 [Pirellulaceae bacterium SH449]
MPHSKFASILLPSLMVFCLTVLQTGCKREKPATPQDIPDLGKVILNGIGFESGEIVSLKRGVELKFSILITRQDSRFKEKLGIGVVHFERNGVIVQSTTFSDSKAGKDGKYMKFSVKLPEDLPTGDVNIRLRSSGEFLGQVRAIVE